MGRNDPRRTRRSRRRFVWPHFVVLAIAIFVGAVESGCIASAKAASASSRIALNNQLETVFGAMVFAKDTEIFDPAIDKQSLPTFLNAKQFANRDFESASSYLMVGAEKADRTLRIALFNVIGVLKKSEETGSTGAEEVGLQDHVYCGRVTTIFKHGSKKPIRNIIGALVIYFDGVDSFKKNEGAITCDAISSHPNINGDLYSANYNQRESEDRLGNARDKLGGNPVRMGKASYVADEAVPVYFPLLAFVMTLLSVPVSVAEIMLAVAKYYKGSRRSAVFLFIFGACTTPLAFLWFIISLVSENASASLGSDCVSATTYGRAEDVRVAPIVIAKFEFRNIERQIFAAHLVISPNDAALDERPKALNRVGVNRADNMLADGVIDRLMRETVLQSHIAGIGVSAEQANSVRNGLADKGFECETARIVDNPSDDVAFTTHRADDWGLASVTASARSALFVPMPVLVASADVSFVNLNNSHQLAELWVLETGADAVRHVERGAIGANAHDTLDLQRTDAFFGGQHHMNDAKPSPETDVRVFEDRSDQDRKAITASGRALRALPMEGPVSDGIDLFVATAGAGSALGPSPRDQIRLAGVVSLEQRLELRNGHLFGEFGHLERSFA
jgi:hypothetical protein